MPSRKFSREFMDDEVVDNRWNKDTTVKVIQEKIVDTSRWTNIYEIIFEYEGKFYQVLRVEPATECQECDSWQYVDEVECMEVHPVEKMVTVYEPVPS